MRELIQQGLEVMVMTVATAAAQAPGFDGSSAALTSIRMIAGHVADTDVMVPAIRDSDQLSPVPDWLIDLPMVPLPPPVCE